MRDDDSLVPVITARDGADADMVAVGYDYWELKGFDDKQQPVWHSSVRQIDTRGYGPQAQVIAAAAVRAELADVACRSCGNPVQLVSRTALSSVLRGKETTCVDCDQNLQERITRLLHPEEFKRRKQQQKQQEQASRSALEAARRSWQEAQHNVMVEAFSSEMTPETGFPEAEVDAEVMALTLLRFSPTGVPVAPIIEWISDYPVHPTGTGRPAVELVGAVYQARLFQVHPRTDPEAFIWEPQTFATAYDQADGDLEQIPSPRRTETYRPLQVQWHVPYGPNPAEAARCLDAHLSARLDPAAMTATRQHDLLRLTIMTMTEEVERYFDHQLDYRKLPQIPDNTAPRLRRAIEKALQHRSLGTVYSLAWRSVKTAAAAAHTHPRAPKENMTTNAVNRFEDDVQRTQATPDFPSMEFDEPNSCLLSAFTRTLFHQVLERDPMTTVATELPDALPEPVPDLAPATDSTEHRSHAPAVSAVSSAAQIDSGTAEWISLSRQAPATLLRQAADLLDELENTGRPVRMDSIQWSPGRDGTGVLTLMCDLAAEPPAFPGDDSRHDQAPERSI